MYRINDVLVLTLMCVITAWGKDMTELEALGAKPNHCTYEYAYDMYGAHCGGLRLSKIPSLKTGIEILDFSDNKLLELEADTLSSYTSIKFLYLAENQIYRIDENSLDGLTDLQTLDLSSNVILELPNSIFQLPSLRKLYLSANPLLHMTFNNLALNTPIRAPLELLDISDCKLKTLPYWGSLPQLIFYNISRNPLISLDVNHFAAMCNLEKVDLTESLDKMNLCSMKPTISWFQERHLYFQLGDYSRLNSHEYEICPVVNSTLIHNATYNRCKAEYLTVQNMRVSRRTWLTVGGGLAGFLVCFMLLLYIMHRHNVAQTKTIPEKIKQAPHHDSDMHASVVLLNNAS